MQASELRLKNLVLCNTSIGFVDEIVSVCIVSSDEIVCYYKPTKQFIFCKDALFEPIPLTGEWLLKFGFKKDLGNDLYLESTSTSFFVWQNNRVELLDNKNNICISYCEYVHQLQNLYFALTGEELTIKEE